MTTQRYELEAWLGDDHGLTNEQIDELVRIADEIRERYPDPDYEPERQDALVVAYRLLASEDAAEALVRQLGRERAAAIVGLRQAAIQLVQDGGKGSRGLRTEAGFATVAGVDRMTVRAWLGKR